MKIARIILASLFLILPAAAATTYYVDPLFTGGSNNGSATNPWTTINASAWTSINTSLASGPVTVYFSARPATSDVNNTSSSQITLSRTDSSTNLLTWIGGYQMTAPSHTWTGSLAAFYNSNSNTATAPVWTSYTGTSVFEIDSAGSTPALNSSCTSTSNTNSWITVHGMKFRAGTAGQPVELNRVNNFTLEYVEWTNKGGPTPTQGPGLIIGCSNLGAQGAGGYAGTNITIQFSYGHDTYGENIYVGGWYGCNQHGDGQTNCPNGQSPAGPFSPGGGGTCYGSGKWAGDGFYFHDLELSNGGEYGGEREDVDMKDCLFDIQFYKNYVYLTDESTGGSNTGGSLCFQSNSSAIVYDNFCHDTGQYGIGHVNFYNQFTGYFCDEAHGTSNCASVYNNILANTAMTTSYSFGYGISFTCDATCATGAVHKTPIIVNNTLFNIVKTGGAEAIFIDSGYGSLTTFNVQNNVGSLSTNQNFTGPTGSLGTHGHNDYYKVSGTTATFAGTNYSCAQIATFEATSQCADPQFVSTSSPYQDTNFSLQSTSPARSAGTNLTASCSGLLANLCSDYFGNARPSSAAWDEGAVQYASALPGAQQQGVSMQDLFPGAVPF